MKKKFIVILFSLILVLLPTNLVLAANTHSIDFERGSEQYLEITDANQTGLDLTSDMTFEAWLKLESQPSGNNYMLISKLLPTGDQRSYQLVYREASGTKTFRWVHASNGSNTTLSDITASVSDDTWQHVAMGYDASAGSFELWIDGVSIGTGSGLLNSQFDGTAPFRVGTGENSAVHSFDGKMDDVRVWSDLRTETEINDNMSVELVGDEAGLVAYFKLNNNSLDETSNNNDLTQVNTPTFTTDIAFDDSEPPDSTGGDAVFKSGVVQFKSSTSQIK